MWSVGLRHRGLMRTCKAWTFRGSKPTLRSNASVARARYRLPLTRTIQPPSFFWSYSFVPSYGAMAAISFG